LLEDLDKVQKGNAPKYLIGANFMPENIDFRVHSSTQKVFLSYKTTGIQTTMLKIEMDAADLKFYSNVADGEIVKAVIRQDSFEAMSESGYIDYTVRNKDSFDASFYVEMVN
jgi:hypothetical protein